MRVGAAARVTPADIAKASAVAKKVDVKLAPVPAYTEYWSTPVTKDPSSVAQDAKQANRGALPQFVQESIVTPGAYVQPGYQNIMPTTFGSLPPKQIADLVAFLTQNQ